MNASCRSARPPRRVRVTGDLFHGTVPDGAVYCGREAPGLRRSAYANPFKAGRRSPDMWPSALAGLDVRTAAHAVILYGHLLDIDVELRMRAARDLAGRDLACWCPLDAPCHVDVLLIAANPWAADLHVGPLPDLPYFATHHGVQVADIGEDGDMVALGHHGTLRALSAFNAYVRIGWGEAGLRRRAPLATEHRERAMTAHTTTATAAGSIILRHTGGDPIAVLDAVDHRWMRNTVVSHDPDAPWHLVDAPPYTAGAFPVVYYTA